MLRRGGLVGFARGREAEGFNIGKRPSRLTIGVLAGRFSRSRQWVNVLLHGLHFFFCESRNKEAKTFDKTASFHYDTITAYHRYFYPF